MRRERRSARPQHERAAGDRNLWLDPNARRRGGEPVRRRRLRRRTWALAGAAAVACTAALAVWAVRTERLGPLDPAAIDRAFTLETVSVEGNRRAGTAELVSASGLVAGTRLLAVNAETAQALVEAHPWVERARVLRVPPSLVLISVTEREPVAVAAEEGGAPWLVDASGLPFAPATPADIEVLPWLVAPHPVRASVLSTDLARGAALAVELQATSFAAGAEIRVAPAPDLEGVSVLVPGLRGRAVLGHGDLREKLVRLERLQRAGVPEAQAAAVIDLRFADRAVLRSASPAEAAQHAGVGALPEGAKSEPGRRL